MNLIDMQKNIIEDVMLKCGRLELCSFLEGPELLSAHEATRERAGARGAEAVECQSNS